METKSGVAVKFQRLREEDLPAAISIEEASYPSDEAASLASLQYRLSNAPSAFVGAYLADGTLIGWRLSDTVCDASEAGANGAVQYIAAVAPDASLGGG